MQQLDAQSGSLLPGWSAALPLSCHLQCKTAAGLWAAPVDDAVRAERARYLYLPPCRQAGLVTVPPWGPVEAIFSRMRVCPEPETVRHL